MRSAVRGGAAARATHAPAPPMRLIGLGHERHRVLPDVRPAGVRRGQLPSRQHRRARRAPAHLVRRWTQLPATGRPDHSPSPAGPIVRRGQRPLAEALHPVGDAPDDAQDGGRARHTGWLRSYRGERRRRLDQALLGSPSPAPGRTALRVNHQEAGEAEQAAGQAGPHPHRRPTGDQ